MSVPRTKLAHKLRQLCEKAEPSIRIGIIKQAADQLDLAAYSLGARGERVKQLSAYHTCLRYYKELAGDDYSG